MLCEGKADILMRGVQLFGEVMGGVERRLRQWMLSKSWQWLPHNHVDLVHTFNSLFRVAETIAVPIHKSKRLDELLSRETISGYWP